MGGRKRKMTEQKLTSAKKLLASGTSPKDVASHLGITLHWIPGASAERLLNPSSFISIIH
jgi:hypothetical protein